VRVASIIAFDSVADIIEVTVGIGILDNQVDLLTQTTGSNMVINEMNTVLPSYGAAAIDIQFSMGRYFSADFGRGNTFVIDNMVVMNFLGATGSGYEAMQTQMVAGTAFTIAKDPLAENGGRTAPYELTPSFTGNTECDEVTGITLSATNFNCMWRRVLVNGVVPEVFTESVYYVSTLNDIPERDAFIKWYDEAYYGGRDAGNAKGLIYLNNRCDGFDLSIMDELGTPDAIAIRAIGDYRACMDRFRAPALSRRGDSWAGC
jgi:hypothetical protein